MTSPESDLTLPQANLLAATVAASGSTAAGIGELVESVYGIELPQGSVYNHLSRLTSLGLVEKSEPRGSKGKAVSPTAAGRDLADERYDWIVERMRQENAG